jgi:ribosomal protein S18 acetylase RimI-like enzyme
MDPVAPEESIRRAAKGDAADLARLIDLAGEGIPSWLWSHDAAAQDAPLEVGTRRAAREEGGFSYRNAHVAVIGGRVAGMLLGYRLPDPYPDEELVEIPALLHPLLELEKGAPGAWYVNALAVSASYRGKGIAQRLMNLAETLARSSGASELSLIVSESNTPARTLYEKRGFEVRGRRASVSSPGAPRLESDWLLMVKKLDA